MMLLLVNRNSLMQAFLSSTGVVLIAVICSLDSLIPGPTRITPDISTTQTIYPPTRQLMEPETVLWQTLFWQICQKPSLFLIMVAGMEEWFNLLEKQVMMQKVMTLISDAGRRRPRGNLMWFFALRF